VHRGLSWRAPGVHTGCKSAARPAESPVSKPNLYGRPDSFISREGQRTRAKTPENTGLRGTPFARVRCCSMASVTAKWPQGACCGHFAAGLPQGRDAARSLASRAASICPPLVHLALSYQQRVHHAASATGGSGRSASSSTKTRGGNRSPRARRRIDVRRGSRRPFSNRWIAVG